MKLPMAGFGETVWEARADSWGWLYALHGQERRPKRLSSVEDGWYGEWIKAMLIHVICGGPGPLRCKHMMPCGAVGNNICETWSHA